MIEHSKLLKLLKYYPETGQFVWLVQPNGRVKCGSIAGSIRNGEHGPVWTICIDRRGYHRGRLAWFYVTGQWPTEIDHKDCDRLNDRWTNIRESTRGENQSNTRRYRNNKTGFKGVFFDQAVGKFRAQIQKDHRRIDLGRFDSAEAAFIARFKAVTEFHGEFGRVA